MGFPASGSSGQASDIELAAAITAVLGSATSAADTLGEIETLLSAKASTSALDLKAPLASPTLTGTPAAPTANAGTSTTQIATTAFVSTAVADLVASSPAALNTLDELAAALGDDSSFATTITNALALKAPLASPTFTGPVVLPSTTTIGGVSTQHKVLATQFDVTSNAGTADITGMTADVVSGNTYYFEGWFDLSLHTTGGGRFNFNGTASVSSIIGQIIIDSYASPPVNLVNSRRTGLGGTSATTAGTASCLCRVSGSFVCNGSGTFGLRFGQSVSNVNASSVLAGSWFRVTKL